MAVLISVIILIVLGFTVHLYYFIAGLAIAAIFTFVARQDVKRENELYFSKFDEVFNSFQRPKPTLGIKRGHGFPHFTVTFQSEGDINVAEASGHLNTFKSAINELCSDDYGGKKNPFNIERAVYATYIGKRYF